MSRNEIEQKNLSFSFIFIAAAVASVITSVVGCFLMQRRGRKSKNHIQEDPIVKSRISELHALQFPLCTIEVTTNSFSSDNKLGEGGFGPVYKGKLPSGQEIAAKRLSRGSGQGVQEFKNEIELVAKLQHRNLVRLLGFSLEREETILVYEYVPNGSLDHILFDSKISGRLDWSRRYKITVGVARGLLYLHEDSRLRIIHRDLKASNILLDADMNPKISDFGMARMFGADQIEASTNRIVGTYDYMSPEYIMFGHFSTKSDVFSFGVLVLEIITGKKNSSFDPQNSDEGLLGYVWKHWSEGISLKLVDPALGNSYATNKVIKCFHIGLLCVQDDPEDRPTMDSVILMLSSESTSLPLPQRPSFFFPSRKHKQTPLSLNLLQSTEKLTSWSANEEAVHTEPRPRWQI
ncbi:cysteine-rich receptor-like protein kinase 10 isoform X2 [Punica granatum]|uniref:Cysteine-rich receptor-like protein kinase 10 isoform X2 n=1 Tax=Punica granatum TaxID=22663 RepID=A0A6P8DXM7_PUNGR|nr:cysteine-rich receptor-like protein kinase 10 isoform X2 [Punica granatum]